MTRELILKRYERGMKPAEIAAVDNLTLAHVEEVISSSDVQPVERKRLEANNALITDDELKRRLEAGETRYAIEKDFNLTTGSLMNRVNRILAEQDGQDEPKVRGRKPKVTDAHLIEYVKSGKTCMEIARIMKTSHSNLKKRLVRLEIFEQAEANKQAQAELAAQEVAVTTECDGFAENFTIAALMKEEEQMTTPIAEVKQETQARDVRNDKWVHFVANQIENAKVKTKFDVVDRDGKLVKQTEVRFVIEEVL